MLLLLKSASKESMLKYRVGDIISNIWLIANFTKIGVVEEQDLWANIKYQCDFPNLWCGYRVEWFVLRSSNGLVWSMANHYVYSRLSLSTNTNGLPNPVRATILEPS